MTMLQREVILSLQGRSRSKKQKTLLPYDRLFLFALFSIIALGLVMVASASIVVSARQYGHDFHFLIRQMIYLGLGFGLSLVVIQIPSDFWFRKRAMLLAFSMLLLILVLIPGIGREVNGSMRWLGFGPLGLQVSELAKLSVIVFMAGYLQQQEQEVRYEAKGFIKPMLILGVFALLLLKEPDFGATVVITGTTLGMMFLGGVRLRHYVLLLVVVILALSILAISSPYRVQRMTTFLNPWAVQFNSGYQLTQSLIAFGRGGWTGVGLGNSIQKLFYLPEAHTDFLFAVLAEELGLVGILILMGLFTLFVGRGLLMGRRAEVLGRPFAAYVAYGVSLWLAFQAMVNMGVDAGVLPTKGLTLPFMSYGGSSILIDCMAVALMLRIDYESRKLLRAST